MTQSNETAVGANRRNRWRWAATFLLCLVIIGVGLGLAEYIKKTSPKAQKRVPERNIPRVETLALFPGDHQVSVNAMGSVVPAREMTLKSRVSGQVESIHPEFMVGGFIGQGERILKIDPQDYRLALVRKESQLINAQYKLKVEMGYQEVAQREWALLNTGKPADPADVELALRKPHLAKARSDLAAARADLEQARLSLSRTDIIAPFNAIVRSTHVDVGSQVSTQDAMAQLVGTDEYWIQVSLPVDRLRWIRIPANRSETGALATVHYRDHPRTGQVIRLLGDLEPQGRMARILVSVKDPLGLNDPEPDSPPLLIGEYVRVEIQGDHLADVYRIPQSALRDNSTIWLVGTDDTLQVTPVDAVWRDDRIVIIKNRINPGDRLIISDLATPVDGMQVEAPNNDPSKDDAASGTEDGNDG
ncbi:MAG: efflux RND transporter periplasmic adaptor subunit [Desulfosarcina sp.]|nr:efflux RND transporter periplasmic adaptor subunit [Desulfosarcina sp.]MBC2741744.1 efflux RND transporter periplasmic adaptor subunit [Desulfosarcina sp.]MBC2764658.1 efflux RND transporter periplasmic adaptor subunit [Desulfosarcina sp.]